LAYGGKIGNVFHAKDIEAAIELGKKHNPDNFNPYAFTSRSMGIDPAYGSSAYRLWTNVKVSSAVYIDGANPSFVKSLFHMIGGGTPYLSVHIKIGDKSPNPSGLVATNPLCNRIS
jgi:hypothetical protein